MGEQKPASLKCARQGGLAKNKKKKRFIAIMCYIYVKYRYIMTKQTERKREEKIQGLSDGIIVHKTCIKPYGIEKKKVVWP